MNFLQELMVTIALQMVNEGYQPVTRPACAYFVSAVMEKAGWKFENGPSGWVPDLASLGSPVTSPEPGDLILFQQTYDAVAPSGIGPEDDYTHVGIVTARVGSLWQFAHYSSTADRPVTNLLTGYWQEKVQEFRRLAQPGQISKTSEIEVVQNLEKLDTLKLFYHENAQLTAVIDGKKEQLMELMLTARTLSGIEICLISHPYQHCPVLILDSHYHPVKFIGEKGIEYMSK